METDFDITSAEGNRLLANQLASEGRIEMAVEAMRAAVSLDRLNADRQFDYANLLIELAEQQSPYFRDQTWAAARKAGEEGQNLRPDSEVGPAIYERILLAEIADAETTRDETPWTELPKGATAPGLRVRPVRETRPTSARPAEFAWFLYHFRMAGGLILGLLIIAGRTLASGVGTFLTPVNLIVIVTVWMIYMLAATHVLGPRLEERRKQIDF